MIICVFEFVSHGDGDVCGWELHFPAHTSKTILWPRRLQYLRNFYVMIGESVCLSGIYTAKDVKHSYENDINSDQLIIS